MIELKLENGTRVSGERIEMENFERLDLVVISDPFFPLMTSVMEVFSGLIVSPSSAMTKEEAIRQTREEFKKRGKTQSAILNGLRRLKEVNPSLKMATFLSQEKEYLENLDYVHSPEERSEFRKMIRMFEEAGLDTAHLVTNMDRKVGNKTNITDLWNNVVLPDLEQKKNPKREQPIDTQWIDSIIGNARKRDYAQYVDEKIKDQVVVKINEARILFKKGKINEAEMISVNDLIFPMMRIATQEKAKQLGYRNYNSAKLDGEYQRLNSMMSKADELINRDFL